jgi:hypothetical protein
VAVTVTKIFRDRDRDRDRHPQLWGVLQIRVVHAWPGPYTPGQGHGHGHGVTVGDVHSRSGKHIALSGCRLRVRDVNFRSGMYTPGPGWILAVRDSGM